MPRAILLEPVGSNLDVSTCNIYGEILYLYPKGAPYAASRTEFENEILQAMEHIKYSPGSDYVVLAGKLGKVCMFAACVANYYVPTLLLVYCDIRKKYVVQRLTEHEFADTMQGKPEQTPIT